MLRESRGDRRLLSLLTISFHFPVTLTEITSETVQHSVGPNTTYELYTFSNIMVGKKSSITPNILYAARRDYGTTVRQQMMISVWSPPFLEKRKCVSNTNNSTVASCLQVDTQHIIE